MLFTQKNIQKIMFQNDGYRDGLYFISNKTLFRDGIKCDFDSAKNFIMERLQTLNLRNIE